MKLFYKKETWIYWISFFYWQQREKSCLCLFINQCWLQYSQTYTYICIILNKITLWCCSFNIYSKDPRYNIILLMPTDKTDTHRLARDLSGKSLRSLRKRLQPTWVRATIPSFMLHGFVTLTSFLQRVSEQYVILLDVVALLMSRVTSNN